MAVGLIVADAVGRDGSETSEDGGVSEKRLTTVVFDVAKRVSVDALEERVSPNRARSAAISTRATALARGVPRGKEPLEILATGTKAVVVHRRSHEVDKRGFYTAASARRARSLELE